MVDSKVSIIIPFYNASSSLFVSLESVLSQSHKFIEVILIDDCSTDNSLEIVKGFEMLFLEKGFEFTLCEHKINQGVAVARNTGLGKATGDFVYFVDADDWIEPDTIGSLLIMASKSSAEIVGCNWYLSFKSNERKMNQPHFETPWEAIYLILCGRMRWNLWIFMVRRELFTKNVISFVPDKNMGEDLLVMLKLFIKAEKVSFIDRRLYHYNQQNENSLTKEYSDKYIQDVTFNVFEAEKELLRSKYKSRIKNEIFYLKLHIKLPLLMSGSRYQYERWLKLFPESHPYILENKVMPLRIRIVQLAAVKNKFWLIKLYYFIIVKIVYGVIYR